MGWDALTWAKIIGNEVREMREDPQILPFIYLTDHLPVDIEGVREVKAVAEKVLVLVTKIGEKTYINTDHILYMDVKLG